MGKVYVKCDLMADGWDYDTCPMCKRFSNNKVKRGLTWRCSLNNASAKEKNTFHMIWAMNYLIFRGLEIAEDDVIVTYVGKRKKK